MDNFSYPQSYPSVFPKTHITVGLVVDRIMTHKDAHVLIPGTCEYFEYVTLHGKGKSKLQMELRLLIS